MARRTYLQRVAEPLSPGNPMLFTVPRPAIEDAQPAILAAPEQTAPATAPMLRREPARDIPGPRGKVSAVASDPAQSDLTRSDLARSNLARSDLAHTGPVAAEGTPRRAPAGDIPGPRDRGSATAPDPKQSDQARTGPVAAEAAPVAAPSSALSAHVPFTTLPVETWSASNRTIENASGPGRSSVAAAGPSLFSVVPASQAEPPIQSLPAAAHAADVSQRPAPVFAEALPIAPATDPVPMPPPREFARSASTKDSEATAPRIHIGTIEVRTASPPVPSPAPPPPPTAPHAALNATPRAAAPPVARAYGWRFGLIQS
jgi:hypothetical protein